MNAFEIIAAIADETKAQHPGVIVVPTQTGIFFDVQLKSDAPKAAAAKSFAANLALDNYAGRKFTHAKSRGARVWWTDNATRLRRGITISLTDEEETARMMGPGAFRAV